MSAAIQEWTYQAPFCPASHPTQNYYRGRRLELATIGGRGDLDQVPVEANVFRWESCAEIEVKLSIGTYAYMSVEMNLEKARLLRDALNDALQDAAAAAALIERQRALDEIREEMDRMDGQTGVYYTHPDVHYVRKGEAAAKIASLTGPCIVIEDDEMAATLAGVREEMAP